jgi:hypothetical protein
MRGKKENDFIIGGLIIFIVCVFFYFVYFSNVVENMEVKHNLAFYTCFYGETDNPAYKIPELPSEKYDCYYFSNNRELLNQLKPTKWIPIYDNKELSTDGIRSAMSSKHVKACPEDFEVLKKYDYLCYLDSKLEKLSESFIENSINTYFVEKKYALLIRHHVFLKDSVWNEFNESMKQERYAKEKDRYLSYINEQIRNGFSETTEKHAQTGLLIRNMNHPKIRDIDQMWYSHIQQCGIQCQISFFFVKQKFVDDIHIFTEIPFV